MPTTSLTRGRGLLVAATRPLVAADYFLRADDAGAVGDAATGQTWSAIAGTWGISGQRCYEAAGNAAGSVGIATGQADCIIETAVTRAGGSVGVLFRASDIDNMFFISTNGGAGNVVKRNAASNSNIGAVPIHASGATKVYRIVLAGSLIRVYVDKVLVLTVTDTFNATATIHGFWNGTTTTNRYDNFRVWR